MVRPYLRKHLIIILLFLFSLVFYSLNLSGQGLTLDEAETVVVARNISFNGVPSPWDGKNFVSTANGLDSTLINGVYVWVWHPWLQHYLTFFGMKMFGSSELGARSLFAFLGALTIPLTYLISQLIFKKKFISILLALHVLFLLSYFLYIRQARYYAPSILFSLSSFYFFLTLIKDKWKRKHLYLLCLVTIQLFFSNYVTWATTILPFLGIAVYKKNKTVAIVLSGEILFAIGWYFYFNLFGGNLFYFSKFLEIPKNILSYGAYINRYVFPALLLIPAFFIARKNIYFIVIIFWILLKLILYSVFYFPHGRYMVDLFPIIILLYGFIYKYLFDLLNHWGPVKLLPRPTILPASWRVRVLAGGPPPLATPLLLFVVLVSINIFSFSPFRFWPRDFYYELTHKYENAFVSLGKYIKKEYKEEDIALPIGLPWSFYYYTNVPVFSTLCNSETGKFVGIPQTTDESKIRWIVFINTSRKTESITNSKCTGKKWQEKLDKEYKKIPLPYDNSFSINDTDIANRNIPPYTVNFNDYIMVFEKKTGSPLEN